MSYNPARATGKSKNKQRRYDPHSGTKHSDILRRKGVGFDATSDERENTRHGFTSPVCSFDGFTQRYVCLFAGNNTGIGVNSEGDRSIRVMSGVLYVTFVNKVKDTDEDGKVTVSDVGEVKEYPTGYTVSFKRGTRYSLASSGTTNVEMLVTETTGYQDTWKEIEGAVVRQQEDIILVAPRTSQTRRPRGESKARLAALKMSGKKADLVANAEDRRRSSGENVNSSTVVGVNPRPSGPPSDDE